MGPQVSFLNYGVSELQTLFVCICSCIRSCKRCALVGRVWCLLKGKTLLFHGLNGTVWLLCCSGGTRFNAFCMNGVQSESINQCRAYSTNGFEWKPITSPTKYVVEYERCFQLDHVLVSTVAS